MGEPITIVMPGKPRGKQRPRFVRSLGIAFTPKQTRVQEAVVKDLAIRAMDGRTPFDGPVRLDLTVFVEIPRSWSRKKREAAARGELRPTGRPDGSNIQKLLEDGCNGVIFRDDSQIVDWSGRKLYAEIPSTVCAFTELALARAPMAEAA